MSDTCDHVETVLPPSPPPGTVPPRPRAQLPSMSPAALGWLVLASIAGDLALQTELAVPTSTVGVALVAGPILGATKSNRRSATFALIAVGFALWLPVRASTWLTFLNSAAIVACLIATALVQRPAPWTWNTTAIGRALRRFFLVLHFGMVLANSSAPLRGARLGRLAPIARGLVITAIPIAVLTALLASADAVFAQSIAVDIDPSNGVTHLVLIAIVASAIAGLVAMTGVPATEPFEELRPFGVIETLILLASIAGLYGAFAFVQLVSALGGADQILQQQGLTYAEYARGGFFQLLWVAALTAMVLGAVRLLTADASPRLDRVVRLLGAGVALLTTVIVAVAIVRLGLYTDEFGQTTLRWYCTAFAWMLGAGFVVTAAGHTRVGGGYLPSVLLGLVVATLFAVNVLNPEARVAQHNLNRVDAVERLDADYLARLSADAWPTLLQHEPLMVSRLTGVATLSERCAVADGPNGFGFVGFNLALHRLNCR